MAGIFHHAGCCCPCACAEMAPSGTEWNAFVAGTITARELVLCYQLASYTDGDLTACNDCDNSAATAWDGTFDALSGTVCTWDNSEAESIDGEEAGTRQLYWDTLNGRWQLSIACDKNGSDRWTWTGTKDVAENCSPAGTYTRAGGCDNTATLVVEACP